MLDLNTGPAALFDRLRPQAPDALLSLISLYRNDPRPQKIDLGVGVYKDEAGVTPVLRAVKAAERVLLETQASKSYLGPEGDMGFVDALKPIVFGGSADGEALFGVQTPGGTGALRLACELINAARPGARIWLGTPSWPNHAPIFAAAGLTTATYPWFDPATQSVRFDEMLAALNKAQAGDIVILHGCCHNPTGADLTLDQWKTVAHVVAARGLLPLIDLAYQGLGEGLEADAAGARLVIDAVDDALVAYSCDKNFGLYRERTGALFAVNRNPDRADLVRSNILALARANWSMPPDHGAAVARIVLENADLNADWRAELEEMRLRIASVRMALADADPRLDGLRRQHGMFSLLPVSPAQVSHLRSAYAVYMAGSGRINLAGLTAATVPVFAQAFAACLEGEFA
ncbi:amino acid aminotransferase [Caulobacter sp. NIBR2454]|uniref:amino acid aminotransferase n=1 Tax=Caulobacter sp. NIBR2454 TaxID=3015996 RepID=UPI0022B69F6D|nr:amino acid aminotransferase [Caulobacter sp. NIBR2454]